MALKFFWRCEGDTLDATHDYTAGDNTANRVGGALLNADAARFGTNGLDCPTNGDYAEFAVSSNDIIAASVGAISLKFRIVTWLAETTLFRAVGTAANNDNIRLEMSGTDELSFICRNSDVGTATITSTDFNLSTNTWYSVVVRWNGPANDMRMECYNDDGTARGTAVETLVSGTSPVDLIWLRIGETIGFGTVDFHIDNFVVADSYSEPLENYLNITSYTDYGTGGGGQPTSNRRQLDTQRGRIGALGRLFRESLKTTKAGLLVPAWV